MYFLTIASWSNCVFVLCCCYLNPKNCSRCLDKTDIDKDIQLPGNLTQCNVDSQVKLADWMRGQACGLCGKADGEVRQELRTPNGHLTKDAVSHAHSWVIPAESCRDSSGNTALT